VAKGEASYAPCAACHGADGNSGSPANPKLAGQHPEYLNKQLQEFKSGKRANAIMSGMVAALSPEDMKLANRFRRLWSLYQQNVDLIQVGAYEAGSNPEVDEAIRLRAAMETFLRQDMHIGEVEVSTRESLRRLLTE
jgi:mono/diheme cytochrome c family protein